jgi:uncharacterized lipoprotein NlpE involved in copper resistance
MRKIIILAAIAALLLSVGCNAKKELDEAAISDSLKKKGTSELLKEAGKDEYNPPSDGRLTDKQIEMYLKVREHEKAIAKVARKELEQHSKKAEKGEKSLAGFAAGFKALGSVADFITADIRAAQELGFNTAEYQWVKERVLEASGSEMSNRFQQTMKAQFEKSLGDLRKQHDSSQDGASKQMLAEMIAGMEKSQRELDAEREAEDPAIAYNRQILSRHENAINALASELSKFENTEGEAQKALEQWEEELRTDEQ